jgi:4-diphosphocytidyl-2-C-methyl-D-erythritol kinase
MKLKSLAKINLDLRVLHKRPDGFHELRTVFQTISLADTIEIDYQPARKTELTIDDALAIPDNLILWAAQGALEAMRVHAQIRFRLTKQIPMGGGLGGGSSNAASILLALPVLAGKRLDLDTLSEIGAQLGSDVPFFLTGGTALGLGRGTELYPLPDIASDPLLIVCPPVHSSTAAAYAALQRDAESPRPDQRGGDRRRQPLDSRPTALTVTPSSTRMNSFRAFVRELGEVRSAGQAGPLSENDFEAAICLQHPQLKSLPGKLSKLGAVHASMTGSGSAFFAVFGSKTERDQALHTWQQGRGNYPAVAAEIVTQRQYRSLWRKQLKDYITGDPVWPPQSLYGSKK